MSRYYMQFIITIVNYA